MLMMSAAVGTGLVGGALILLVVALVLVRQHRTSPHDPEQAAKDLVREIRNPSPLRRVKQFSRRLFH